MTHPLSQRSVLLDRLASAQRISTATAADVAAIEAVPLAERLSALSTYDALRQAAQHAPGAPAIQLLPQADPAEPAVVLSHAELFGRITQTANLLHSLGVGSNEVVSFLLPLLPQAFAVLYGAEAAGISNPVNPLLEPHQLAEILNAAQTKVLVCLGPQAGEPAGTGIWDKVLKIRDQIPSVQTVLVVGADAAALAAAGSTAQRWLDFDTEVARQPADRLVSGRQIQPGDTAGFFHTGGTTGTPKLVRHSHLNQVYQAWVCASMLQMPVGSPILFGLPLYHVGGALTQGLATLANGGCLVVLSAAGWRNPAAVKNVWKLVDHFRPGVFGGVPTVLAAAAAIPRGDADTSYVRVVSGGGSAIPVAVGQWYADTFRVPVLEVYGMTETSSVHTISYPDRELRLGTVGHAVPYSRVRVVKVDANGQCAGDCAVDEIGVVAMAGPGVLSGYLHPDHNRNAFVEPGWVNSGDLGRLDAQGYLWITGRAKDLVIRGGHNIDPMPIEEAFYQHPAVALAAVVGQPDAYAGELPLAYVQPKPDVAQKLQGDEAAKAQLIAELHAWVRERTPERAAVPVAVLLIDAIPLTGVGKVFKPALRWQAAERVFAPLLAQAIPSGGAGGVRVAVSVGADGTHGTLARVVVQGGSAAERAQAAARASEVLAPFTIRHEVMPD
jgi:fatty-acyl-CoA synthase